MLLFLLAATAAVPCQLTLAEWRIGQTVKTTSGEVTGRGSLLPGNDKVSEYLAIPYAAPPVGALRWEPPQPYVGNRSINATSWGA
jgi:carboxylesterase type B